MKGQVVIALVAMGFTYTVGASPAQAQATRTWVSGVGDDANPCSRTAPCKTFAGAYSRTAASGEINCLDPGGFGTVTISKAISIICDNGEAGVLAGSGVPGIVIAAGPNDVVVLSGLDIQGIGVATDGIRFLSGGALHVRNTIISGFRGSNGHAIAFQPSGSSRLMVDSVHASDNGDGGGTAGGLLVQPTGGGSARATVINSDFSNNTGFGIRVDATGNTGPSMAVDINGTRVAANTTGVSLNAPAGTTGITIALVNSIVSNNSTALSTNGGASQFAVSGTTISGNITEMSQSGGGTLQSFGDNVRVGNIVPGTFGGPAIPKS